MASLTVRIAEIVCCFNVTRVSLTCSLMENPLSTSACPWLITQGCFHHNHQTVVLWITQTILQCGYTWPVYTHQLMQHGRSVFLPIPVVYQRLLDTISIQWTANQENSSRTLCEAPTQPVVSSFECCLDFFSWKASDTECWTGTCSSKAILLGRYLLERFRNWIISLCGSASRGFLSAFSFLEKADI